MLVRDDDLYLLDIRAHGAWTDEDLVEIVHANWPDTIAHSRLRGLTGPGLSSVQRKNLRDRHMTTGVQVQDGTFYAGIGGGIVGSGDNFRAILQSFQGVYSLGRYLIEPNTAYSSALLECYLKHIVLPDVQAQLFGYPLSGNAHEHRAGYKYAILKTDKEIWESLYADAVRGVACYRSLLEVTMPATTCLFSGRATGEGTTEEHTLLRAIGGRFRSQTAASSSFNNATSNILDAPLAAPYALIMNALAPLLSSEHQPGGLDLIGEPGDPVALRRVCHLRWPSSLACTEPRPW